MMGCSHFSELQQRTRTMRSELSSAAFASFEPSGRCRLNQLSDGPFQISQYGSGSKLDPWRLDRLGPAHAWSMGPSETSSTPLPGCKATRIPRQFLWGQ